LSSWSGPRRCSPCRRRSKRTTRNDAARNRAARAIAPPPETWREKGQFGPRSGARGPPENRPPTPPLSLRGRAYPPGQALDVVHHAGDDRSPRGRLSSWSTDVATMPATIAHHAAGCRSKRTR
jgi:hypothetical protein